MEEKNAPGANQELGDRVKNRTLRPISKTFEKFMATGWDNDEPEIKPLESSKYIPARQKTLSQRFPGERLIIPAGQPKVRNNDDDYAFRPDSTFTYYTGLGKDYEAGAVLVLEPNEDGNGHTAKLFVAPRCDNSTPDYYMDDHYGEYWVGARAGLKELKAMTGIDTVDIANLPEALAKPTDAKNGETTMRIIRDADPDVTGVVDAVRAMRGSKTQMDDEALDVDGKFREFTSEARIVKDDFEINEVRKAVDATKDGFDRILTRLPKAVGKPRSERMLEGEFTAVAREEGNALGYDTIVASGVNAPTLHWMRNPGTVGHGELLLIDAGVEMDSLYTADITRTFPVDGKFTDLQKKLYQAVLDSQQAGFDAAQPGATYSDIHHACMRVIAERLHEWGILKVDVEESLSPAGQQHRRWLACGVAHHLGLDVHDCAQARYESYHGAKIRPGMIFTIEPGLYFAKNDLMLPEELRGIGIRIEDDVLMTEHGPEWISAGIPKQIDEVEAWMAEQAE